MIRNLLATTALATLVASGAYAQDTTQPAQPEVAPMEQEATTTSVQGHLASNIIGESVYNSTAEDAENIGEVKDIVLDAEGNIEFLVVGVGGFLGLGEKQVAVEFAQAEWAERDGDRWLVVPTTKEQLEAQAEFDPAPYEPEPAAVATDTTAPAGTMAPSGTMAPADQTAEAPADTTAPATDQPAEETAEVETTEPADQTAEAPADTTAPATDQPAEETAEVETIEPADQTAEAPADATAPADQTTEQTAEVETVEPTTEPADQTATTTAPAATDQTQQTAQAPADPAAPAATTGQDATQTGAIDRSTLQEMPMDQIRAEDLIGTTVYGANEENIGEIGDVVLSTEGEGQIDAVLVDVGGFLGLGEKQVAIGMDKLTFMQDENENRYLYTNFTKEQLEAQPAYDESTYAENRDQQRLIMTE